VDLLKNGQSRATPGTGQASMITQNLQQSRGERKVLTSASQSTCHIPIEVFSWSLAHPGHCLNFMPGSLAVPLNLSLWEVDYA
jgi:hypothetical protein